MMYGRKAIGTVGYLGGLMSLPEPFCWAWGQMIQYNAEYLSLPNEFVHQARGTVSFHSAARNSLIDQMLGDWLLQLDTDHRFEPDICARMMHALNEYGVDVLTGVYVSKAWPHAPILYRWNEDKLEQLGDWDQTIRLFEIGSAGGGNLMVRRNVFDRIRTELKEGPFDIIPPYGEDHSFFLRLKRLGIHAYCAPYIETTHLAIHGYGLSDFARSMVDMDSKTVVGGYA